MSYDYEEPCHALLETLIDDGVIEAAILCTVDGLPITHASRFDVPEDAISAMFASMLALSDTVVGQVGGTLGCRQVVVESPERTIAIVHAGESMALSVTGNNGVNLGMIISHANAAVQKILNITSKSVDKKNIEQHTRPERASLDELVQKVLHEAAQNRHE